MPDDLKDVRNGYLRIHRYIFKLYRSQQRNIQLVKNWVMATVSDDYLALCCDPFKDLRTWYLNLKAQFGEADERLSDRGAQQTPAVGQNLQFSTVSEEQFVEILAAYRKATLRPEGEYHVWLDNWASAMREIYARNITELKRPSVWVFDLEQALGPEFSIWSWPNLGRVEPKIKAQTLHYFEVVNNLRRFIESRFGRRPSLSPSQSENSVDALQEDEEAKLENRTARGKGRKRQRSPEPQSRRTKWKTTCAACENLVMILPRVGICSPKERPGTLDPTDA